MLPQEPGSGWCPDDALAPTPAPEEPAGVLRGRPLELTTAGHRLRDAVEPLLEGLDRALAQFARQGARQALRVRLPALFANELFIPRLGIADGPPQGLKSERLFSCALAAVCARQHAGSVARLGRKVLAALPLIIDRTRPFAWSSWAAEVGLATPEPKRVIELDTMIAVVRAAERGLGIALVRALLRWPLARYQSA